MRTSVCIRSRCRRSPCASSVSGNQAGTCSRDRSMGRTTTMTGSSIRDRVRSESGIADFYPHALRHTAETRLAELRVAPHIRDLLFDHRSARGAGAGYDSITITAKRCAQRWRRGRSISSAWWRPTLRCACYGDAASRHARVHPPTGYQMLASPSSFVLRGWGEIPSGQKNAAAPVSAALLPGRKRGRGPPLGRVFQV